ncbi:MAG: DCC1-like thiol-disulfide oxidoreductase family protein [Polyangiaceae bacterium]
MALALIGDWAQRWADARSFFSNEGALPNHAHLYHMLRQDPPERVWSVFHAFSSPGENRVALLLTLIVYLLFLFGHKTRIFHVLSLALFVSLTGRNLFTEGPWRLCHHRCPRRDSLPPLRKPLLPRLPARLLPPPPRGDSHGPQRAHPWNPRSDRRRPRPRLSPTSSPPSPSSSLPSSSSPSPTNQVGPKWQSGSPSTTASGSFATSAISASSPAASRKRSSLAGPFLLRYILLPSRRSSSCPSRPAPRRRLLGDSLLRPQLISSSRSAPGAGPSPPPPLLLIPEGTWEAYTSRRAEGRTLTVIYDADCGICLWISRLLRRLDLRSHLTFQGNDSLTTPPSGDSAPYRAPSTGEEPERVLYRREKPGAPVTTAPLPAEVTDDLVLSTVVAVDEKGQVHTESQAVALIVRSLPLGALLSLPLRIPGFTGLWNALYRTVADRRLSISESVGLGACGIPPRADKPSGQPSSDVPPAVKTRRFLTGLVREAGSVAFLLAILAAAGKSATWPAAARVPENRFFEAVTGWSRARADYALFAPEPPSEDGVLVIDAQTRGGQPLDTLTGKPPVFDPPTFHMGVYWSEYSSRIRNRERPAEVERMLRDYLAQRGGPAWSTQEPQNQIVGLDAYWVVYKLPAPGGTKAEVTGREKLFSFSRGGKGDIQLPIIKPALLR